MVVYLKRFGVTQQQLESLPLGAVTNPPTVRAPRGSCSVCQQPATKRCGKCGSRAYCSNTCQREEWKVHKIFCALHPFPSKPVGMYVTAMLLPEKEKEPRIIHVQLTKLDSGDGDEILVPVKEPFLGKGYCGTIRSNALPGYPMAHLRQPIQLVYRDNFMRDGSEENVCVANLFGALCNGQHDSQAGFAYKAVSWKGPIIAFKLQSKDDDPDRVDLEMADVHHVLEFLFQYGLACLRRK
eukprot:Skav227284  [mRNA]  locus=scaffold4796:29736:30452:+ [translate_table: standard]